MYKNNLFLYYILLTFNNFPKNTDKPENQGEAKNNYRDFLENHL